MADDAALEQFNRHGDCVCGNDDVVRLGRFSRYSWCNECDRRYVIEDDRAVHPAVVLATEREGLVHASEDWAAFYLLTETALDVQEYIEGPPGDDDEAWLWAHDGLYIGYLLYRLDKLRTMALLAGYRNEGHGTAFVTTWFEQLDADEVEVMAFDRTESFFEQLDVPVELE